MPDPLIPTPLSTLNTFSIDHANHRVTLHSPTVMPKACGFLWNRHMMIQVNCRGYASAQYMAPEPCQYSRGPALEATTFMQPEHSYYTHHPGRFFYLRDNHSGDIFSVPYEPCRTILDSFSFEITDSTICWQVQHNNLSIALSLTLAPDDPLEMWQITIQNTDSRPRSISLYPCFSIGYMSWMNQSASFDHNTGALLARSITPYQKVEQYYQNKTLKDLTFLLPDRLPTSWCANLSTFEGEGGLSTPDALKLPELNNDAAHHETPVAVMQFALNLTADGCETLRYLFGPANNEADINALNDNYFSHSKSFRNMAGRYQDYLQQTSPCLTIATPDKDFDAFVNHWLPRQMYYHGDVNRLSTDPQTRNYLQDAMGMSYLKPAVSRQAFITALSQQRCNGAMPDGILLHPDAELKYINQVPHSDHCVWLPICLSAYLDETADYSLLNERLRFADENRGASVYDHIDRAMRWLLATRDDRGLLLIAQGDWCDPMNMAGHKGKGVSSWLSLACAYSLTLWVDICKQCGNIDSIDEFECAIADIKQAVNCHCWDGQWYGRGINDDGKLFGCSADPEGRIFLNPQSFALLAGAAQPEQQQRLLDQVKRQLHTPYGPMMLAPAFTSMREDIGRITQKYPGTAENGSVYNHAAAFYALSLYAINEPDTAYRVLRQMIPAAEDAQQRGQLPVFIPNYYRGAYHQLPHMAGRSSQLLNTGTVAWYYRCLIEGLCGLKGDRGSLLVAPQLPQHWRSITVQREFCAAHFHIDIRRADVNHVKVSVDGLPLAQPRISDIVRGHDYQVTVLVPEPGTRLHNHKSDNNE